MPGCEHLGVEYGQTRLGVRVALLGGLEEVREAGRHAEPLRGARQLLCPE